MALSLFLLSLSAQSSNCSLNFEAGMDSYQYAVSSFEKAQAHWQDAVNESESGNPNRETLCSHISKAKMDYQSSIDSFKVGFVAFDRAAGACNGQNRQSSINNRQVCQSNQRVAQSRLDNAETNYENICRNKSENLFLEGLVELIQLR